MEHKAEAKRQLYVQTYSRVSAVVLTKVKATRLYLLEITEGFSA